MLIIGSGEQVEIDETVTWVDVWFNNESEIWTIQKKTKADYQVGDAEYTGRKWQALQVARQMAEGQPIWVENRTSPYKYKQIQ